MGHVSAFAELGGMESDGTAQGDGMVSGGIRKRTHVQSTLLTTDCIYLKCWTD